MIRGRPKKKDITISVAYFTAMVIFWLALLSIGNTASAKNPPTKAKFYDFSESIINGEVRKPTALYTNARERVKFKRLLRLKRSFMDDLMDTAKDTVFK